MTGDRDVVLQHLASRGSDTLLVSATGPRLEVGRPLVRGTADRLLQKACCPVIIQRVRREGTRSLDRLTTLLVPLDGSRFSELALPHAMELARASRATIRVLRVVPFLRSVNVHELNDDDPEGVDERTAAKLRADVEEIARPYLGNIVERVRMSSVRVTSEVRVRRAGQEIITASLAAGAALIVMTS